MLRIHFTAADLGRIQIAREPNFLWESLLSLHMLQTSSDPVSFGDWRTRTRQLLTPAYRPIFELTPPRGYSPDFLTPTRLGQSVDASLDLVLSTPKARLRSDLTLLARERPASTWSRKLAEGDVDSLHLLGRGLRAYHHRALEPYWSTIRDQVGAVAARHRRLLRQEGAEQLLSRLHPAVKWQAPVLVMDYPQERDVHLDGRGVVLVPSFFCSGQPVTVRDPEHAPVLVYPVRRPLGWAKPRGEDEAGSANALAALLGRTRSTVLLAISHGCSTGEAARMLGISPSSVSEHASVLRAAGLVCTERVGGAVHHTLTALGASLLDSGATLVGERV